MRLTGSTKSHALSHILLTMVLAITLATAFNTIYGPTPAFAGQDQEKVKTADETTADADSKTRAPASVVELTIDYGDGAQKRFTAVPWKEKMTVGDAMNFAKGHAHGVTFESRGKGKFGFLSQIDDLKNEAGGGRNWIFYVNEKRAEASFAVTEVPKAGAILWRFEEYK